MVRTPPRSVVRPFHPPQESIIVMIPSFLARTRVFSVVAAMVMFPACADSIVSDCDVENGPLPVSARFSDIEQRVFAVSCATAGCHGGSNPQAGLDLTPGRAYDQLVNVNSLNYPTSKRVAPGASAQSVLLQVLRGSAQPSMPPSGPLATAVVDSIAAWIDRGAERN